MRINLVDLPLKSLYLLILLKSYSNQFTCPSVCVCPSSEIVNCKNFSDFSQLNFSNSLILECQVFELNPLKKVNKLIDKIIFS